MPTLSPLRRNQHRLNPTNPTTTIRRFTLRHKPRQLRNNIILTKNSPTRQSRRTDLTRPIPRRPQNMLATAINIRSHTSKLTLPTYRLRNVSRRLNTSIINSQPTRSPSQPYIRSHTTMRPTINDTILNSINRPRPIEPVDTRTTLRRVLVNHQRQLIATLTRIASPHRPVNNRRPHSTFTTTKSTRPRPRLNVST